MKNANETGSVFDIQVNDPIVLSSKNNSNETTSKFHPIISEGKSKKKQFNWFSIDKFLQVVRDLKLPAGATYGCNRPMKSSR